MVSLECELERDTLTMWAHMDPAADNADLMVFFAGQLHDAKEQLAGKRRNHEDDPGLAQDIIDLTELAGVLADAYRRQRPAPLDPYVTNPLAWAVSSRDW